MADHARFPQLLLLWPPNFSGKVRSQKRGVNHFRCENESICLLILWVSLLKGYQWFQTHLNEGREHIRTHFYDFSKTLGILFFKQFFQHWKKQHFSRFFLTIQIRFKHRYIVLMCWFLAEYPRLLSTWIKIALSHSQHFRIYLRLREGDAFDFIGNTTGNCWPKVRHSSWVSEALNLHGHFTLYTAAIACQERCTKLFGRLSNDRIYFSVLIRKGPNYIIKINIIKLQRGMKVFITTLPR